MNENKTESESENESENKTESESENESENKTKINSHCPIGPPAAKHQ
ncbi:hypothetical protein [Natrialba aegyptia]